MYSLNLVAASGAFYLQYHIVSGLSMNSQLIILEVYYVSETAYGLKVCYT